MTERAGAWSDNLRRSGPILAYIAILIGLLALLGWTIGSQVLKSTVPGEVTMKPNTAVSIILLGLSAISLARRRRWIGYLTAGLAAAIGGITLIEYATGWNPGIDTLLFSEDANAVGTSEPGRMAPNAAGAFLLCGAAMLSWDAQIGRYSVSNLLLVATAAVGLLALIGYSSDVQNLFGLSQNVTSMAVPSATSVFLLGVGGLLMRPEHGVVRRLAADGPDGAALRALLPTVIAVPTVVGLVISRLERSSSLEPRAGIWLLNLILISGFIAVALLLSRRLGTLDAERHRHELELEQRAADLAHISDATRQLARTTGGESARELVCEVAREVAEAPIAALLEPAGDGHELKVTARAGSRGAIDTLEFGGGTGGAEAFVRRERVFDPELQARLGSGWAFALGETARSALWQPVMHGTLPIGVLAVAWEEPRQEVIKPKLEALEAVAAEAAVAIDRAALLGRLESMARTDELTGLHNRRVWEEELRRDCARAARDGRPLCVALIDLDRFKDYNDRHGHQAGDRLLHEAAASWKAALRATDLIARYGGEEFGLLLPDCDREGAIELVERLRVLTPGGITCSCGIAEFDGYEEPAAVVGRADAALYRAKRAGRDRTVGAAPSG